MSKIQGIEPLSAVFSTPGRLHDVDLEAVPADLDCNGAPENFEWFIHVYFTADNAYMQKATGKPWQTVQQRTYMHHQLKSAPPHVITHNGEDIGFVCLHQSRNGLRISQLHILPDFQGNGFGRAVLKHALDQAHQEKLPLQIEALKANDGACRLYESFGFEAIGYQTSEHWGMSIIYKHRDTPALTAPPTDRSRTAYTGNLELWRAAPTHMFYN